MSVESVTHNCKLFCCELPDGVIMRVPIGHHIHMHRNVEGMLGYNMSSNRSAICFCISFKTKQMEPYCLMVLELLQ